ncbi:5-dehydro-2-deoxygluconokinase [Listeria grayi]|uniref:2-dehydro-3-deoxygluconokinase n=1 Tax=Listeria grayi FSL F6-1183 TaxID=1265827 RepID=A0A829RB69_LISGR|nr:sugar kinase [Listeria grayi]EUJ30688.1 2-dehydro-3-deoxygluconokinase [Listeria grayi FSL F6-1183]VEI31631.1 5-dehydro-2-deoxygluconokinase [Listeria grayi]
MKQVVTIGEMLMRLSTQQGIPFSQTTALDIHIGGAEANVAVNLSKLGHPTRIATVVPANPIGKMAVEHLWRHQVDTAFVVEAGDRLGTYYLESGTALKAPSVVYDRQHSSFARHKSMDWDLSELLKDIRVLHVSGITIALSTFWLEVVVKIIREAKRNGIKISFDMNYRAKLWKLEVAKRAYQQLLPLVDYCSAGQMDAVAFFEIPSETKDYYQAMHDKFPNIELFYATKRTVISASHHLLQGHLWTQGECWESEEYAIYPIVDRVGGGDAYTAAVLHGILSEWRPDETVKFATAAAGLKHSIHGDINPFDEKTIADFAADKSRAIVR